MRSLRVRVFGWIAAGALVVACGGGESQAPGGPTGGAMGIPASGPGAPPAGTDTPPPGTPPPAPVACARADAAHTAPVALFDAFQKDVASLSGSARTTRAQKLLTDVAAAGGTPLEDPASGRVVFLASGAPPSGPWSAVGSFAGWDKTQGVSLAAIDGTDLYWGEATIPRGASQTYKLLSGTDDAGFAQDRLAHNLVWDGIDHHTVGEFNAIIHPQDLPADKGRIEYRGTVHAQKLANDRDVFVYLPPRYDDASCPKLPVVVFHDGNESLTRGDFAGVADTLYAAHPELSAVLAFIALPSQDVRMDEYTFGGGTARGDDYVDFLLADLLPTLDKGYRLCGKAEARGISGASLGGLISTYTAFQSPATFGWVGAQSASFFWDNDALVTRAQNDPKIPVRFYLDSGAPNGQCGDPDNCAITDQMQQVMLQKGYDVVRVKANNADHDWSYWHDRLGGMLTQFRDGHTACD
jgi:enterochelin esterase family protein